MSAAGIFGKPGIVIIDPHITTINSAPEDNLTSLIGISWFVGAPFNFGSVEKLYWVFATQTGKFLNPLFSNVFNFCLISSVAVILSALYISFAIISIFSHKLLLSLYKNLNFCFFELLQTRTTFFAKSTVPAPPSAQCLQLLTSTFKFLQKFIIVCISFLESKTKWLIATIGSMPNF